jgi:predicted nucleic acid-binding protein
MWHAIRSSCFAIAFVAKLLVDTGFLVALYRARDELHRDALLFLERNRAALVTISPVIVETCCFLDPRGKIALLEWIAAGGLSVIDLPADVYPAAAKLFVKYRELDADFTDVALVWFAEQVGERRILTVDERDFAVFRLKGKRRFELEQWYQ